MSDTKPVTEYGISYTNPVTRATVYRWPDRNGTVELPSVLGSTRLWYANTKDIEQMKTDIENYRHWSNLVPEVTIVERTYTIDVYTPKLPTTPGSLVRSKVDGEGDSTTEFLVALTSDIDSCPWIVLDNDSGAWVGPDQLVDWTVVYDAGDAS